MTKLQQFISVPLALVALILGIFLASFSSSAFAQSTGSTTQTGTQTQTASASPDVSQGGQFDPHQGGHVGKNGVKEVLLTGDQAQKATSAALAAVPGATIERVETDAEGDAYEAHMVKSDGSHVTVKFDTNFNVVRTEDGPNGPQGGQGNPLPQLPTQQ